MKHINIYEAGSAAYAEEDKKGLDATEFGIGRGDALASYLRKKGSSSELSRGSDNFNVYVHKFGPFYVINDRYLCQNHHGSPACYALVDDDMVPFSEVCKDLECESEELLSIIGI
jgi:hypothetical protein